MQAGFSYRELFRTIAGSPYGSILAGNVRFGRFKPETIKNSTWERILGPDVNNLRHMWFTKRLTDQFLAISPSSSFNQHEQHLLRLSATFHDLAESVVGDIPRVDKTINDEQHEKLILTQIVAKMSQESKVFLAHKSDIIYCIEHILFPSRSNRLSRAFTVIEYLGYLHTACRAGAAVDQRRRSTPLWVNLTSLASEVTDNSLAKLDGHRQEFPAITSLLRYTSPYQENLGRKQLDYDYLPNLNPAI